MPQVAGNSLSFWQDEARVAQRYQALDGPAETDVVVIGGGITGTAGTLWLARDGKRVMMLERETIAHGASGRNGGFLLAGTVETYDRAIAHFGRERARDLYRFSVTNNALVRALIEELEGQGWPTGYRQTGSLRLADSPEELAEVQEGARLLNEDGWPAEVVGEERLPPRLRGHYLGGAYHPNDGEIQPARLVTGIAELARQAGALIYERTPALNIREEGAGAAIETPAGVVRAHKAILATNAWLDGLLPHQAVETSPSGSLSILEMEREGARSSGAAAGRIVTPTRGQMLATAPVGEHLFDCPIYAHEGYQYWRQLQDGRLVVGGWRDLAPDLDQRDPTQAPTDVVQQHLDHFVYETLKLPRTLAITHRWAGLMAFTSDSLPVVGFAPGSEHILLCGGYTGHGNAMAVCCARLAVDLACGIANSQTELFAPERLR